MKEIRLLKKFGPLGVISMFYKGAHTNLVEITKNGLQPILVTDQEFEDALQRGFGVLIKRKIVMVTDIEEPVRHKPTIPAGHFRNAPRPRTILRNDALIIKTDDSQVVTKSEPEKKEQKKPSVKKSRSRKK